MNAAIDDPTYAVIQQYNESNRNTNPSGGKAKATGDSGQQRAGRRRTRGGQGDAE